MTYKELSAEFDTIHAELRALGRSLDARVREAAKLQSVDAMRAAHAAMEPDEQRVEDLLTRLRAVIDEQRLLINR